MSNMGTRVLSIKQYIESKSTIQARITAITNLISQMELEMLEVVGNSGTASYSLDDGQVKITTNYRTVEEVSKGINALEQIKQRYINRHNGSIVILRGKTNY